ncbi:putative alpha-1,6-mannosyltransferase MNN11 [Nakaseomyces bracarensis]|uniref:Alpha-1,6-mannosyltransferase MNN11 n=1 Tax=Nakaseomyces bracarensis TaxID=273131 RepID=A0ABR4P0J3_9SACH
MSSLKPKSLTAKKRRPSQSAGSNGFFDLGSPQALIKKYVATYWNSDIGLDNRQYKGKKSKKNRYTVVPMLVFFVMLLYVFMTLFMPSSSKSSIVYPGEHGEYVNELVSSSPLIFPHVEHAPVLKEIGIRGLYILRMELDGTKRFVLKPDDKPFTDDEKKKTTDQVLLVKKSFLDHGKLIFPKKNESPEFIIVTLVDFENYDRDTIVKIVQNRVDYAQKHRYGLYVRWAQEFITEMVNQDVNISYEYMKASIMRAAIHAFPYAKYFFFLDETSLVMNLDEPLQKLFFDNSIVEKYAQNLPILQHYNGKNVPDRLDRKPDLIFAQRDNGILDLSAFAIANSLHGKLFLDYLNDPLVRDYKWDDIYTQYGHVLNWHKTLLQRTRLFNTKLFASPVNVGSLKIVEGKIDGGSMGFSTGDFVASMQDCKQGMTCIADITKMYQLSKSNTV